MDTSMDFNSVSNNFLGKLNEIESAVDTEKTAGSKNTQSEGKSKKEHLAEGTAHHADESRASHEADRETSKPNKKP